MAEIEAIAISDVLGSQPTDDGKHALVKVVQPDRTELVLAVPAEQLFKFIDSFALSAMEANQKASRPKDVKPVFPASWFELGADTASGAVVLSLTFGAGGTLSFHMPRFMAEQLRETLNVHLGGATPQTPGTSRH